MKKIIITALALYIVLVGAIFVLFRTGDIAPSPLAINPAVHYALTYHQPSQITNVLASQLIGEFDAMSHSHNQQVRRTRWVLFGVLTAMLASVVLFVLHFYKSYLAPFKRLKHFAAEIAMGNLDIKLTMQANNPFGAFTESFDIMRQELKLAKDRENRAQKAKYELVAKMSHDIRTPIASSLSTIEVMALHPMAEFHAHKLESIAERLNFMGTLASNMFNATLEELTETKTNIQPINTHKLAEIIRQADHQGQVESFTLPACIVDVDRVKLYQVLNNIISNAYKYADTPITVAAKITDNFLAIDIADHGPGVPDVDRHLIFNKFYRSESHADAEGYGLGLYITKQFMEAMGGSITAKPSKTGLHLRLNFNLTKS